MYYNAVASTGSSDALERARTTMNPIQPRDRSDRIWRLKQLLPFVITLILAFAPVAANPEAGALRESFSASHEPIRAALARLATLYGTAISTSPDVQGEVTVVLRHATMDEALSAILVPYGYRHRRESGRITVFVASNEVERKTSTPTVIPVTTITSTRAASIIRTLFPEADIRVDQGSNSIIAIASPDSVGAIRAVIQGIDIRDPSAPLAESIPLRTVTANEIVPRLRGLYTSARFEAAPNHSLLVYAPPAVVTQVKALVSSIEAAAQSAVQAPPLYSEAIPVYHARPKDAARSIVHEVPHIRADIAGSAILLSGVPDDVARAKTLLAAIDVPASDEPYTTVYRIKTIDATSVGDLLTRTFAGARVVVDKEVNALSVTANPSVQQQISDAIKQLDQVGEQSAPGAGPGGPAIGGSFEVVTLRSAVPNQGQTGGAAADISTAVVQTLQQLVPSLRVSALATPGQIALIGDPMSLHLAKDLLLRIDVPAPLVVLDTEVLELDENVARNLGVLLTPALISTTFSEVQPPYDVSGQAGRLIGFQPLTRTPLSFTAELNLQIQNGKARVLADPRITTISGRTATIRAGDTINILTTTGGGTGTIATTQLQSFQTGVTLDITPLVTADDDVTVALHPIVNSLTGILNGIPQISTRDTQTVVHLKNNETLVIGGLIQESRQETETRLPILGDLPLIGHLLRNTQVNSARNELIIVLTPHIITDGSAIGRTGPPLPSIPTPIALPTLPPDAKLMEAAPKQTPTPAATDSTATPNTGLAEPANARVLPSNSPSSTARSSR
jgi:type II secretory pathway component GspD/PulD (secretin)